MDADVQERATTRSRSGATTRKKPAAERSTTELVGDLSRQMTKLVHDELELAKAELVEKGKRGGIGVGMFGAAAGAAVLGLAALTAAAIAALALVWPVWAGALLVGGVYMVVAGTMAMAGRVEVKRAAPPVPTEAIESSKEDVEWLKTQATSGTQ